jgi:hypothetical protein
MEISQPNEYGAMRAGHREIVARHSERCFAAVNIALCEDGLYRQSTSMMYSYGGHSSPVFLSTPGYRTFAEAIDAGLHELLRRWHGPFHSEPQSVRDELDDIRQQIESRLKQPSLF